MISVRTEKSRENILDQWRTELGRVYRTFCQTCEGRSWKSWARLGSRRRQSFRCCHWKGDEDKAEVIEMTWTHDSVNPKVERAALKVIWRAIFCTLTKNAPLKRKV